MKGHTRRELSDEELSYIRENHSKLTISKMAKHLSLSDYKVQCTLMELGITKQRVREADSSDNNNGFFEHDLNLVTI
jgi:hypothetical protein